MKISVCIIATNQYKQFVPELTKSICEYFLLKHQIELHIFTDDTIEVYVDDRVKPVFHQIRPYKFPEATLYRYKIMTSVSYNSAYLFYIDADMLFVDKVGDEILGDIVAVRHPGYYNGGWGSENINPQSTAYLPKENWLKYYAGGFQGGVMEIYSGAMLLMKKRIDIDEEKGITAQWHDESHWNHFLATKILKSAIKELSPEYCMPEAEWKREAWKINDLKPKILALEKQENIRV